MDRSYALDTLTRLGIDPRANFFTLPAALVLGLVWFASIVEMIDVLREAEEGERGDVGDAIDDARQRIHDDALCVEVRGGWHSPGGDNPVAEEYSILLATGGPACRLIGTLDEHGEPESARLEHQDWETPWKELEVGALAKTLNPNVDFEPFNRDGNLDTYDRVREYLLAFASQFYFGEG